MNIRNFILCASLGAIILLGVGCHSSGSGFIDDNTSGGDDPVIDGIDSLSIVRLDGESLDLNAGEVLRPVPLVIQSIQLVFSSVVEDTSVVEDSATVVDSRGTTVAGTFSWSGDGTTLNFIPDSPFAYETTYTLSASDEFGEAVGSRQFRTISKGDINGDGVPDIIIGAYNDGAPIAESIASPLISFAEAPSGTGAAYVYSGADLSGAPLSKIVGTEAGNRFGVLVASAGDVNVDGYADIAVGGVEISEESVTLKIHIFSGADLSTNMTSLNAFLNFTYSQVGISRGAVADVGDVNGDGIDDLLMGVSGKSAGFVYFFEGGVDLVGDITADDAVASIIPASGEGSERFGYSVAGAGDVNGDSYADIIVGAPSAQSVGAYIFSGVSLSGELTTSNALASITKENENDEFGVSLPALVM